MNSRYKEINGISKIILYTPGVGVFLRQDRSAVYIFPQPILHDLNKLGMFTMVMEALINAKYFDYVISCIKGAGHKSFPPHPVTKTMP